MSGYWAAHPRHTAIQKRKTLKGVVYRARVRIDGDLKTSSATKSLREALKDRDQLQRRRDAIKAIGHAPTIEDLVIQAADLSRSEQSRAQLLYRWENYVQPFLVDRDVYLPEEVTQDLVQDFKLHLDTYRYQISGWKGSKAFSKSTKEKIMKILHNALKRAFEKGLLVSLPDKPRFVGAVETYNVGMTLSQVRGFLAAAPSPPHPHRAMLLFAAFTGMDWGMVSSLNRDAIDGPIREGAILNYYRSKTGRKNALPLTPRLARELILIGAQDRRNKDPLFVNPETGKRIGSIKRWLASASKSVGLKQRATFHSFRHFAITNNMQVLGDANRVSTLSTHSNPNIIHSVYDKSGSTKDELMKIEASLFGESGVGETDIDQDIPVPYAYLEELATRLKGDPKFVKDAKFLEELTLQRSEINSAEQIESVPRSVQSNNLKDNQEVVK